MAACANAGVAAVADSSTAAARALNEIISFLLYGSIVDSRGQDDLITLREPSVLSRLRAICLRHPMRIPAAQCTETARRLIKFRFKTQLRLKRALQSQSPADRHSRTAKLITARQGHVTKSCRVNTG